ncbi:MAG: hypothetical protein HYU63_02065, partial [Armatimonadetes bacterium]|nr:hypothetical protein [Armatimonadota bacterium]
ELKKEIVSCEEKLNKVYQEYNLIKSNLASLEDKLKIFQEEIVGKNNLFKLKVKFLDILEEEKLLFNKIKFPYGQEKIFTKFLKEHLSDLVINSKEEALDLIKKVKGEKKSANLWILNNLNLPSRAHNFEIKHPDIIGWADELVDFSSSPYSLILKYLLEKILILKNLKSAFTIIERFPCQEDILFITLEGEILDSRGFLKIKEESDDFSYQEEKKLKEEINKLKEEVKKLENERIILINKENDSLKEQEYLRKKESNLKINLENLDKEINELERNLSILNKEILENNQDINNLKEGLKKDSTQSNDFEKLLLNSEEKAKSLQDAFLVFKEQKESKDKLIKEREEFKIKIATLKQKENDLKEQKEIFLESQENEQLKIKEIRRQIEILENKQIENQKNYESVKRLILKVKLELKEKEKIKEEKIKEKNNLILSIEKKERCLENFQKEKEIIQGKFYNLELKKVELENQIRDLKTKLSQLGILPQIESNFIVPENLEKKIQTLKNFINNFGGVNLGIEEDYHNLKERADFLNQQLIDLENAKNSLIRIIKEYDQECTNKFQDVFKQVNQIFPEVFKEIFGGGEAQLILEEDKDPLEAGVEIIVRLPGRKRLQNLSLLSGGEKALSALAFLFTLLKI